MKRLNIFLSLLINIATNLPLKRRCDTVKSNRCKIRSVTVKWAFFPSSKTLERVKCCVFISAGVRKSLVSVWRSLEKQIRAFDSSSITAWSRKDICLWKQITQILRRKVVTLFLKMNMWAVFAHTDVLVTRSQYLLCSCYKVYRGCFGWLLGVFWFLVWFLCFSVALLLL